MKRKWREDSSGRNWDDVEEDDKMGRINSLNTVAWFGGNDCDLDQTKRAEYKKGREGGTEEDKIGIRDGLLKEHYNNLCG